VLPTNDEACPLHSALQTAAQQPDDDSCLFPPDARATTIFSGGHKSGTTANTGQAS